MTLVGDQQSFSGFRPEFRGGRVALSFEIVAVDRDGEIVPPVTKKNHGQIITVNGRPVMIPSPQYKRWEKWAVRALQRQLSVFAGAIPLKSPLNMRATVHRDRRVGDLVNYLQAVCDLLQANLGTVDRPVYLLTDDKWVQGFDGSRLAHDPARPRVEVHLEEL